MYRWILSKRWTGPLPSWICSNVSGGYNGKFLFTWNKICPTSWINCSNLSLSTGLGSNSQDSHWQLLYLWCQGHSPFPLGPFEVWQYDFIQMSPSQWYQLFVICMFSHWVEVLPCRRATALMVGECLCLWWGLALECPWVCMWACVCRPVCLCDVSCVCESVLCMVSWDYVFDLRLGWEGRCQNVCVCLHCQICDGWPSVYICQPFCAVCFLLGPGR